MAQHRQPAHGGAQHGHEEAEELGHGGDLVLGVADVQVEGVGHHAHGDVADPVDRHQRQQAQGDPPVAAEEVPERGDQSGFQPLFRVAPKAFPGRRVRLPDNQGGDDAHAHQPGHGVVGAVPGVVAGDVESPGAGHQHGGAVAEDVGGGHGALEGLVGGIDAVGVDADVLGGGAERHQQRQLGEALQVAHRLHQRHRRQRQRDAHLGQQQPAAPLAEQAVQQRQLEPVHHRRPEHLDGKHDAHPTEIADGGPVHVRVRQPGGQGGEHQQVGQPRGEPQEQHHHHAGVAVELPGGAERIAQGRHGFPVLIRIGRRKRT